MKRKYFVLPLLLVTSFLTGCGGSAPKDQTAMKLVVVTANPGEIISFSHNDTDKINVDWGDGSVNSNNSYAYVEAKEYTITITGVLESFKYTTKRKDSLISVTIGNIISLADSAFSGCKKLVEVKCLENVRLKEISEGAFNQCIQLTSIVIPDSVTSINYSAFTLCSNLTSVAIPDSVTSIGGYAFNNCGLKSISINSSSALQTIGVSAFGQCSNLYSIAIPNSVVLVGADAFSNCTKLETVSLSSFSLLQTIGNNAFKDCSSLKNITIPNSVVSVGASAFENCNSLEPSASEDNVKYLGNDTNPYVLAWSAENDESSYTINSNCKILYPYIFSGKNLTSIVIPNSVVSIGNYAFQNCEGLQTVLINPASSLKEINESAFYSCSSLTSIAIPGSVTLIGGHAFYKCSSLKTIDLTSLNHVPSLGGVQAFDDCDPLKHIYVRSNMLEAFKTAENWSDYADIITAEPIPESTL